MIGLRIQLSWNRRGDRQDEEEEKEYLNRAGSGEEEQSVPSEMGGIILTSEDQEDLKTSFPLHIE